MRPFGAPVSFGSATFAAGNATALTVQTRKRANQFTTSVAGKWPYNRWGLSSGPYNAPQVSWTVRYLPSSEASATPYVDLETAVNAMLATITQENSDGTSGLTDVLTVMKADGTSTVTARVVLDEPDLNISPDGGNSCFIDVSFTGTLLEDFA